METVERDRARDPLMVLSTGAGLGARRIIFCFYDIQRSISTIRYAGVVTRSEDTVISLLKLSTLFRGGFSTY